MQVRTPYIPYRPLPLKHETSDFWELRLYLEGAQGPWASPCAFAPGELPVRFSAEVGGWWVRGQRRSVRLGSSDEPASCIVDGRKKPIESSVGFGRPRRRRVFAVPFRRN